MNDTMIGFVRHDLLVYLYQNPLNAKIKDTIASMFFHNFGMPIETEVRQFNLVITPSETMSHFMHAAYDVAQTLGIRYFTNPDYKPREDYTDLLITEIDCAHESAADKIAHLKIIKDTNVIVSFKNPERLPDEPFTGLDHVMLGFEAKQLKPEHHSLPNALILEGRRQGLKI